MFCSAARLNQSSNFPKRRARLAIAIVYFGCNVTCFTQIFHTSVKINKVAATARILSDGAAAAID